MNLSHFKRRFICDMLCICVDLFSCAGRHRVSECQVGRRCHAEDVKGEKSANSCIDHQSKKSARPKRVKLIYIEVH